MTKGRIATLVSFFVLLILASLLLSGQFFQQVSQESLSIAENAIRRSAVECYALEGFYPTSYAYLRSPYGVAVNEELYFIDYQYIASTLMPDITFFPLRP